VYGNYRGRKSTIGDINAAATIAARHTNCGIRRFFAAVGAVEADGKAAAHVTLSEIQASSANATYAAASLLSRER
jgi:hypothetical protein